MQNIVSLFETGISSPAPAAITYFVSVLVRNIGNGTGGAHVEIDLR